MKFNRKIFWDNFKPFYTKQIKRNVTSNLVASLEFLLDSYETYDEFWQSLRHIAYSLATTAHETNFTFEPVREAYWKSEDWRRRNHRYYPYDGRGFVQLTWESGYRKAQEELIKELPDLVKAYEARTNQKMNLVKFPSQAMDREIAFGVMTLGMHFGWFRKGHSLDRYINDKKCDYLYARFIINGIPRGETLPDNAVIIKYYAERFEAILRLAKDEHRETIIVNKTESDEPETLQEEDSNAHQTLNFDNSQSSQISEDTSANSNSGEVPASQGAETYTLEDWKPFCFRWGKRVWASFTGLNFTQFSLTSVVGANSQYAKYWIIAGAIIFIITLFLAIFVTLILLGIWAWNRREIFYMKFKEAESRLNPSTKNLVLAFEKK